jgi:DNA-binding IclR family transcriptional regulator
MARREATIQSVDRAIEILECLASRGGCASLSELADDLGLCRSTVHGQLATLKRRGMVAQETNACYVLGIKLFELGTVAISRLDLRTCAGPVLERLVDQFQETVHLVIGDGLDVIYIDKRESPRSVRIVSQVGARLPAYCTGFGTAGTRSTTKRSLRGYAAWGHRSETTHSRLSPPCPWRGRRFVWDQTGSPRSFLQ